MGNHATIFALRNDGDGLCPTPRLELVTGHTASNDQVTAELTRTYFTNGTAPDSIDSDEAVRVVIATTTVGVCASPAVDVDALTIALTDDTTFAVSLSNVIDASCVFAADIDGEPLPP
jgi:hypothetical protein